MDDIETFLRGLPKTDLHVHLEGSLEPELLLALAGRNGVRLRWDTAEGLRAAYRFRDLASFLDLYFEGCRVLVAQRDFFDATVAYLRRAREDGVVRAEMFVGPQSFTAAGVPIEAVMEGVLAGMAAGRRDFGVSVGLMVSVHRHRSEAEAMAVLDQVMPWRDRIIGIGMGGPERGNPPSGFAGFFRAARARGFRTTVHAGEEGPAAYVREALEVLQVDRIDHGNACLEDPALVRDLAARRVPLTVCPLSNLRLRGVTELARHPLRAMMAAGLHVTVNSDDPPYFDGYVTENLLACREALDLSREEIVRLVRNGFEAAWVNGDERRDLVGRLEDYVDAPAKPK